MNYSIVDIELTEEKEIIEIAIIKTDQQFNIISKHDYLLKSISPISRFMENLTGITQQMVEKKPHFSQVAGEIHKILGNDILICHGVIQDYEILKEAFLTCNIAYKPIYLIDTVELSKIFFPTLSSYRLGEISQSMGTTLKGNFHRADVDTEATYNLIGNIIEKLNMLTKSNYSYLMMLMKKYSIQYYNFFKEYRKNEGNVNSNFNFKAYGLDFSVMNKNIKVIQGKKYIYLSSIDENSYIDIHLANEKNISILKDKFSYIALNIFELAKVDKKFSKLKFMLLMRLLVWLQFTESGNFSELNLDPSEKTLIQSWYEQNKKVLDTYYYDKNLDYASKQSAIVTDYRSILNLLNEKSLEKHIIVAENKDILAQEIKKQYIKSYYYKEVVAELNINLTNRFTKKLSLIKDSIDNVVVYLHELYRNESIDPYEAEIEFLLKDIDYIRELIESLNIRIFKTEKFTNLLWKVLSDGSLGYYSFDHINMAGTLYLKVNEPKNQKIIINKLHSRELNYLNETFKLIVEDIEKENIDFTGTNKNILYLFEYKKNRDLRYLSRDKKSTIRYKQYSEESSFADLYKDLLKNVNITTIYYASSEIKVYAFYLDKIFDKIFLFKKLDI
ncbi:MULTISPECIES: exonuclease domain-containing protein [unclassified Gemella]|uniref:exonuclease domain-containing protein n=1 Tax=unclassified Gemella TaxID=2624949 RepID=UPI001073B36F|nr:MULTISPECIES: exonuclease domain-containing protein [unclassified Gemella]MBF0710193.1 hypothetical protein [Gemella sp. GL1.1]MBF0746493.1 hypothetical protein [Gemella sp. 19428wG2_WT2a]NYS27537.1 hypothetical protein [Gemella sp. GL1]TFU60273.1 hypothetical protein E4T67_02200 [Gemella sp. WT2a]